MMEKKVMVKQRNCWNQIKVTLNKLCYCEKKKDEIQIILNQLTLKVVFIIIGYMCFLYLFIQLFIP